ncbi:hypothetical protein BH09PSE2_BH09PSE2_07750 [soil metagenome]
MSRVRLAFAVSAAFLAAAPVAARAQESLAAAPATAPHFTGAQSTAFAFQIEQELTRRGAGLAVVFRTGRPRDKLPKGIAYTHGAFWVRRAFTEPDGKITNGYLVYNLYAGDGVATPPDQSTLVQDFPTDFTPGSAMDDVAILIPTPAMQAKIVAAIDGPVYEAMHIDSYSLIANPLSPLHQNCNSFMLNVIAAAGWGIDNPATIRARLKARYTPTTVSVGAVERLLAPMSDPRVKTDDQGLTLRTATYASIAAFMRAQGWLATTYTLRFQP